MINKRKALATRRAYWSTMHRSYKQCLRSAVFKVETSIIARHIMQFLSCSCGIRLVKVQTLFWILSSIALFSAPEYIQFDKNQLSECTNSKTRDAISLAGGWHRQVDGQQAIERVNIPFTDTARGKVIYTKTFRIEQTALDNKVVSLYFIGILGEAELYLNNDFALKVNGYGLPQSVSLEGKRLLPGVNELRLEFLEIGEIRKLEDLCLATSPYYSKGLTHEPLIILTSKIYIRELNCKVTENEFSASLRVRSGKFSAGKSTLIAEYNLIDPATGTSIATGNRALSVESGRTVDYNFNVSLQNLLYWSADSPNLYTLRVYLKQNDVIIDEYFENIGRRSFSVRGNEIIVNSTVLELKSISYYEYYGDLGKTLPARLLENDVKRLKMLGANAIRFRFAPPSPYLISLCEKYGLFMLVDLPLNNINSYLLTNKEFISYKRNCLSQILTTCINSPALLGIGLGDGVEENATYSSFLDNFVSACRKHSVLVYKTVELGNNVSKAEVFDFIIAKANNKHTNDKISNYINTLCSNTSKPVVINCWTSVFPGNSKGYSDKTSTEYQSYFFQNCYNLVKQHSLCGILINSFNDYRTNSPLLTLDYWDSYRATEGITDLYRQDKPAATMLSNLFLNEKLPLLNRGSTGDPQLTLYIVAGLLALLAFIFTLNRQKRFREYCVRALLRSYNFFSDIRDKRIMPLMGVPILGFLIAFSIALCFASLLQCIKTDIDYTFLLGCLLPFPVALETLFQIIHIPVLLLLAITLKILLLILLISVVIYVISLFLRKRFLFKYCFSIVVWVSLPFIVLLPVGVVLSKMFLVAGSNIIVIFTVIFGLLAINWIFRLFKSLAVVFDRPTIKVTCFGLIFIILFIVAPVLYYVSYFKIWPYMEYFAKG